MIDVLLTVSFICRETSIPLEAFRTTFLKKSLAHSILHGVSMYFFIYHDEH